MFWGFVGLSEVWVLGFTVYRFRVYEEWTILCGVLGGHSYGPKGLAKQIIFRASRVRAELGESRVRG